MENTDGVRPLIFWEGFPPCGLLTKQLLYHYGHDLKLLGSHASEPFRDLEHLLGSEIHWLNDPNQIWDLRENFSDRNLVIHTGWNHSGWLKFDRWIKRRGAKVVVVVDNRWKRSLRQIVGAIWFRAWLRRHFDAVFVPGASALRLMRFLGMPEDRIFTGSYGAYEEIYQPGLPLSERRPEFLFVGQLSYRKGVDILLEAFHRYRREGGRWSLRILGAGLLVEKCKGDGIIYEGFGQANLVAQRMAESRCLILPSRDDHWGTVVCEAMACGTPAIASRWVGATEDLIKNGVNGFVFNEMSASSLALCMSQISKWSATEFLEAEKHAIEIAKRYNSSSYRSAHLAIVSHLFSSQP
jgi:glycosyltransferase involved in cell wall biosynthesis